MTLGAGGEEICLDDGRKKAEREREAGATGWFITSEGTGIVIYLCEPGCFLFKFETG